MKVLLKMMAKTMERTLPESMKTNASLTALRTPQTQSYTLIPGTSQYVSLDGRDFAGALQSTLLRWGGAVGHVVPLLCP